MKNQHPLKINTRASVLLVFVTNILVAVIFFCFGTLVPQRKHSNSIEKSHQEYAEQASPNRPPKIQQTEQTIASSETSDVLMKSVAHRIADEMTPTEIIDMVRLRDPVEALELMNQLLRGDEWTNSFYAVFPDYAAENAYAAAEMIKTLKNDNLRGFATLELAQQWSRTNAREAFRWIETLEDNALLDEAYYIVMKGFANQSPQEAATIVSKLESSGIKDDLISEVAGIWARQNIDDALIWMQQLSDNGINVYGAEENILMTWSEQEPAAAFEYVLAKDMNNEERIDYTFNAYVINEPEQAAAYIDSLPERCKDLAAESVARNWLIKDQQKATQWVAALPPGLPRDNAVRETAQYYMEEDPNHALAWAAFVDRPEERIGLMSDIIGLWCDKDMSIAERAIQNAPVTEEEKATLTGVLHQVAEKNKSINLIVPGA